MPGCRGGHEAVEYVLEHNLAYTSGAEWLGNAVLRERWTIAAAGTHGKTTTASMIAHILDHAGLDPRVPDRRCPGQLFGVGAARHGPVFRGGSRRIRHVVLRQTLEVPPLPTEDPGSQQPRVRSRRHLRRPRPNSTAVPPPGASRTPHGFDHRAQARPQHQRRTEARLLDAGVDLRPGRWQCRLGQPRAGAGR